MDREVPIRLSEYDNSWYNPGRSLPWRAMWHLLGAPILSSNIIASSTLRILLLRLFGASIGKGVVIKPGVVVKYPWHLIVGDNSWLGEACWIDNLTTVRVGHDVCISQGVYLCTGNHDWSDPRFGLLLGSIQLGDGAWAGAKAILTPGAVLGVGAVAGAGSVVSGVIPDFEVYAGNPATFVRKRTISPRLKITGQNVRSYRGYRSEAV